MAERCCSIADLGLWPVPYHDWNPYLPPHLPALPHCVPHHDWAPYPLPPYPIACPPDLGLWPVGLHGRHGAQQAQHQQVRRGGWGGGALGFRFYSCISRASTVSTSRGRVIGQACRFSPHAVANPYKPSAEPPCAVRSMSSEGSSLRHTPRPLSSGTASPSPPIPPASRPVPPPPPPTLCPTDLRFGTVTHRPPEALPFAPSPLSHLPHTFPAHTHRYGTVTHQPPEALGESNIIGYAGDIYAFGVLLWQVCGICGGGCEGRYGDAALAGVGTAVGEGVGSR